MKDVIYNNLTLNELNDQYNNLTYYSIKIGNNLTTKEYVKLYTDLSDKILNSNFISKIDLKYGNHVMNRIDFFRPLEENDNHKLIIWLHGGNWGNVQISTKEINTFVANGPLKNGFHFASVEYPFNGEDAILKDKPIKNSGGSSLSDIINDVHKAINFIIEYATTNLNIDTDDIYLCGHSAGAHLSCLEILKNNIIKKGIFISLISDLKPISLTYLNNNLKLTKTDNIKFSPILNNIPPDCKFLIINGSIETSEFKRQSYIFYKKCKNDNIDCQHIELEGHGHLSILLELAKVDGIIIKYIINLTK